MKDRQNEYDTNVKFETKGMSRNIHNKFGWLFNKRAENSDSNQ